MRGFRADPRFNMLVSRMKLPDYWAVHGPPDGYDWRDGRLVSALTRAGRPACVVASSRSVVPEGGAPHLDAHPRRHVGRTARIVHGDVRHAVRARRAGIVGLEHQHLVALHVAEVRPAVPGVAQDDQRLEGPLR